jgi:hypothetical protein
MNRTMRRVLAAPDSAIMQFAPIGLTGWTGSPDRPVVSPPVGAFLSVARPALRSLVWAPQSPGTPRQGASWRARGTIFVPAGLGNSARPKIVDSAPVFTGLSHVGGGFYWSRPTYDGHDAGEAVQDSLRSRQGDDQGQGRPRKRERLAGDRCISA